MGGEGKGRGGEAALHYTQRPQSTFASSGRDNLLWLSSNVVQDWVDEPRDPDMQPLLLHLGGHPGVPAEDDSSVAWLHWDEREEGREGGERRGRGEERGGERGGEEKREEGGEEGGTALYSIHVVSTPPHAPSMVLVASTLCIQRHVSEAMQHL